ncbi:MAG: hypothetical protein M1819_004303 [Sarea resinae]|nr:MAG: hypothetical protein M1819_004303 [Sarea resinae]
MAYPLHPAASNGGYSPVNGQAQPIHYQPRPGPPASPAALQRQLEAQGMMIAQPQLQQLYPQPLTPQQPQYYNQAAFQPQYDNVPPIHFAPSPLEYQQFQHQHQSQNQSVSQQQQQQQQQQQFQYNYQYPPELQLPNQQLGSPGQSPTLLGPNIPSPIMSPQPHTQYNQQPSYSPRRMLAVEIPARALQQSPAPVSRRAPVSAPSPASTPATAAARTPTAPSPVPKSTKRQSSSSKAAELSTAANHAAAPLDYQLLLLSLAEEYFDAAHRQGSVVALAKRSMQMDDYYKLIATGLSCLEIALKKWRMQPRMEAIARLRYASVLYEETDNDGEAEMTLSKGITLCERYRMADLKYSMQHLLVRLLFKSNPRAAMRLVDSVISDAEALKHVSWIYAFRFLRVSLSIESTSHQEVLTAFQHLRAISGKARERGESAVFVLCAVLEAIGHLRSPAGDSIEQAQRALAAARSQQLDEVTKSLPQIVAITHFLDVSCSLEEANTTQATNKLAAMQTMLDQASPDVHWGDGGSFSVPLKQRASPNVASDAGGVLQKSDDGQDMLAFSWLPKNDVFALGYFLSGVTMSYRNSTDGQKAEKYLLEGLRIVKGAYPSSDISSSSLSSAMFQLSWRKRLACYLHLHLTLLLCARTDWTAASNSFKNLQEAVRDLGSEVPEPLHTMTMYITGVLHQGTGDTSAALNIFRHPSLALPETTCPFFRLRRDIHILATLNTVFLVVDPSHPQHDLVETLLSNIEPLCTSHPNENIQSAFSLAKASALSNSSTVKLKHYLQHAIRIAKKVANSQITCIVINFMAWKFFRGVVGEQAEKSARAGLALAKKDANSLWISVADGILAETLQVQSKTAEAQSVRTEAVRLAEGFPPALHRTSEQ